MKWRYQPNLQGASWRTTIIVQRGQLADHLNDSPSLKSRLPEAIARAYRLALAEAIMETGLAKLNFPEECPWQFEQVVDEEFYPPV